MATDEKKSTVFKRSGRGGARPGAGRPKGRKDSKTLEIEAAAKEFAGDALKALHYVATRGESEPARVSAAIALLDRGYGKPRQALEHTGADGEALEVLVTRRVVTVSPNRLAGAHTNGNGNGNGSH